MVEIILLAFISIVMLIGAIFFFTLFLSSKSTLSVVINFILGMGLYILFLIFISNFLSTPKIEDEYSKYLLHLDRLTEYYHNNLIDQSEYYEAAGDLYHQYDNHYPMDSVKVEGYIWYEGK